MLTIDSAEVIDSEKGGPTAFSSVEIFSGAGGLALGLELAGFRHSALVERDRDACSTLRENGSRSAIAGHGWPVSEQDVRAFDYSGLEGKTTLLAGGAPCQPFSLGGLQRGDSDPRNLFPEVFRAVRELRPQAILLENVRNLAGRSFRPYFDYICLQLHFPFESSRLGEDWQDHNSRLERLYASRLLRGIPDDEQYDVQYRVLNAADYGVPQLRHRVFIVGFRRDLNVSPCFPVGHFDEDALLWSQWGDKSYWEEHEVKKSDLPNLPDAFALRVKRMLRSGKPPGLRWRTLRDALRKDPALPEPVVEPSAAYQKHYLIPGARVYEGHTGNTLDRPAKTIKAGDHGNPGGEHVLVRPGCEPRYLSIRECARIQTFPDSYHFLGSRSECMRQLGNAVPVELARQLGQTVHAALASTAVRGPQEYVQRQLVGF